MSADEIHRIVTALGSLNEVLREADPADKGRIYRETILGDPMMLPFA